MVKLNDNHKILSTELPSLNNESSGVISKIAGSQKGIIPSPFSSFSKPGGKQTYEVSLDLIKTRPVNDYVISGIDELAGSIKRTGLWQPIILRKDPDNSGRYIIVAGERRYTAVKKLWQEAVSENNEADIKSFSTITSIILSAEDAEKEAQIYSDTNEFSRQITNFERILRMDPVNIDLTDPETKREYIELCYGKNADDDSVAVRGSIIEKSRYIAAFLNRKNPDLDISEATVKNYLIFISRSTSVLLRSILKGVISLRDARRSISYLSEKDQEAAILAAGTDAYEDFIRKGLEIAEAAKQPAAEKTKEPEDLIASAGRISRKLYSARNDFEKIYNDTTYRRDLDEDQKDYISKLRLAMSAIEALKASEEKLKEHKG